MRHYKKITVGPSPYISGPEVEDFTISDDEIEESREDGDSDDDVINYLLQDEVFSAEQRFCTCIFLSLEDAAKIKELL